MPLDIVLALLLVLPPAVILELLAEVLGQRCLVNVLDVLGALVLLKRGVVLIGLDLDRGELVSLLLLPGTLSLSLLAILLAAGKDFLGGLLVQLAPRENCLRFTGACLLIILLILPSPLAAAMNNLVLGAIFGGALSL